MFVEYYIFESKWGLKRLLKSKRLEFILSYIGGILRLNWIIWMV